jgi:arylsulfatase A-like enzyme
MLKENTVQKKTRFFAMYFFGICLLATHLHAQNKKPNILVIFGDDIGIWNLSIYSHGDMGYRTPNIDRIGKEGAVFSDHYAQASCTAGRAAFITGQLPIRTGLTTVGVPGAKQGLQFEDATLAEVLKTVGYTTGQFGKNHLGDRNEYLPTVHGFDEFFGNLYHLNSEEEPEDVDYPTDPAYKAKYGPRGVLHSYATTTDDPTTDSRFGRVGKQKIENTGPLTRKRMETVDMEFANGAFKFMEKAKTDNKPFFVWLNTTRMHVFTHVEQKWLDSAKKYTSGDDIHGAGMIQHDYEIGLVLQKLNEMGIADNTIVIYSSDNGPEHSTYPFGATTPYRSEKMTTWEGAFRVPMMVRWPGHIVPGTELNGIQSHEDLFVTLAAAAGIPDVKERLAKGDNLGTGVVHRCYIDGVNNLDYWTGKTNKSNRDVFYYYAESKLQAIRFGNWKVHFAIRDGYYGSTTTLEIPWLFNIRQDPFESFDQAPGPRANLSQHKSGLMEGIHGLLADHLGTFKQYPPRQKAASLNIDKTMEEMMNNLQKAGN